MRLVQTRTSRRPIVLHPFEPGGQEGDPEQYAETLVDTFGAASTWRGRDLGFAVLVNPLQERDTAIRARIRRAFLGASTHRLRLLVHVNHEWMFGFFPSHDIDYGNSMIETLTGVRPLGINQYSRVNSDGRVLGDVEWLSWSEPLSQYVLYWASPSVQPPRIAYTSGEVSALLRQKATVVREALDESYREFFGPEDDRFLGIDVGWETAIDDQGCRRGHWLPRADGLWLRREPALLRRAESNAWANRRRIRRVHGVAVRGCAPRHTQDLLPLSLARSREQSE